jgi:hypothetical protein
LRPPTISLAIAANVRFPPNPDIQAIASAMDRAAHLRLASALISDQKIKGPASYFPSIEEKYGRPISEWEALLRARPQSKHMEHVAWLKAEHGMGHGHANALVAHTFAENKG